MNQSQNTSRTLNYKAYHFIGYFKNGIQLIQPAALEMIIFPLNCDASNNSNSSSAPLHFSLLYLQVLSSPPPPPLPVGARIIDRPVTAQRRGTLSLFQLERTNRGRQSEEGPAERGGLKEGDQSWQKGRRKGGNLKTGAEEEGRKRTTRRGARLPPRP